MIKGSEPGSKKQSRLERERPYALAIDSRFSEAARLRPARLGALSDPERAALREDAAVRVLKELPLRSPEDRPADVISDALVELGTHNRDRSIPLRLVRILGEKSQLLLVTDKQSEELSAELIRLIYRKRWQIELFFKWIKCILGCRHWLAESPRGVAMPVYLALIAELHWVSPRKTGHGDDLLLPHGLRRSGRTLRRAGDQKNQA